MKNTPMKNTVLIILFFATFSSTVLAQVRNRNVKSDYVMVKYEIGGAIERLDKNKTYKVAYPQQMNYNKGENIEDCWDNIYISMDAKKAKGDVEPSITYEIATTGLNPLNKVEEEEVTAPIKGWVKKIYYNFPLKIIVKNDKSEIVKEVILHDDNEVFWAVFHENFQIPHESARSGENPVVPFVKHEKLEKAYKESEGIIKKRLERNQALKFYDEISRIIYAGYDYNKFSKTALYFYSIKKDFQANYSSMQESAEKLGAALTNLQEEAKQANAFNDLNAVYLFYKQQLSTPNLPEDVVKLCLYNGALAAVTTGNLADVDNWFSEYYVKYMDTPGLGPNAFEVNFNKLYNVFAPYYILKKNTEKLVTVNLTLSAYANKIKVEQQAAEEKAKNDSLAVAAVKAKNPNIIDQEGYIVLNTGEKMEGLITALFVKEDPKSNIYDLSLGKSISVQSTINDSKSLKNYKTKEVSSFVVNSRQYDKIEIKTSGLAGALLKPTGTNEFFIKVLQKGDYTIYKDASSMYYLDKDFFYIKSEKDGKAYSFNEIIGNKKNAQDFIAQCAALAQKITAGTADIDTPEKLVVWLNNNCK